MRIQFLGAARTVTGSMHLLEVNGTRVLLDCGLFQGRREEANERNRRLPLDPRGVDCVILSHAHIDHSGNVPSLCKNGFTGPIYSTFATRDLCRVMLEDSAHIHEQDAIYLNKKTARRGLPPVEPLYTVEDARRCLREFVGVNYEASFRPAPGVTATLIDAGHILGSSAIVLDITEGNRKIRFAFTGDVGRCHTPIICDPAPLPAVEYLITESTYGDRLHTPIGDAEGLLADAVNTASQRGGKVVIPSFSVGRTQELVWALARLRADGRIPDLRTFVDSPLSVNATEVFRMHPECFDEETNTLLQAHEDPFGFGRLSYVRRVEDSKQINFIQGPCIIISASGMCESGRILHHLKNNVTDARNMVLIVGFQAENTLGRRIVEKVPALRIFHEDFRLRAEVRVINALSAHADRDELLAHVQTARGALRKVFVVHGEEKQSLAFADTLLTAGIPEVAVPAPGECHDV